MVMELPMLKINADVFGVAVTWVVQFRIQMVMASMMKTTNAQP
jgi:hypothetical protein